jgi:transcriptional regulator with XRE-family HTH domain
MIAAGQKGLTLAAIETMSGGEFRHSALGAYERGARTMSVHRLERLAAFYQVPVSHLLPRVEGEAPIEPQPRPRSDAPVDAAPRAATAGDRRLHIDLVALEGADADLAPLRRYVGTICRQRGAFDADTITLRDEDLQPVASLCGMEAVDAVLWLHRLGVLSRTP